MIDHTTIIAINILHNTIIACHASPLLNRDKALNQRDNL